MPSSTVSKTGSQLTVAEARDITGSIPHTFLITPFGTFGFYPTHNRPFFGISPGEIENDASRAYKANKSVTYNISHAREIALFLSMANNGNDPYDFFGAFGENCTTWADTVVSEAGITDFDDFPIGLLENPYTVPYPKL
jgi:hypothetical protein